MIHPRAPTNEKVLPVIRQKTCNLASVEWSALEIPQRQTEFTAISFVKQLFLSFKLIQLKLPYQTLHVLYEHRHQKSRVLTKRHFDKLKSVKVYLKHLSDSF